MSTFSPHRFCDEALRCCVDSPSTKISYISAHDDSSDDYGEATHCERREKSGLRALSRLVELPARSVESESAVYTGQWLDNQRHGHGSLVRNDGGRFDGCWLEDRPSGRGCETLSTSSYTGDFRRGRRHGHGYCLFNDGRECVGEWADGRLHGCARMQWPDGARYEGEFRSNRRSGQGVFTWPDGRTYSGEWHMGVQHGRGTYTDGDDYVVTGSWKNGEKMDDECRGLITPFSSHDAPCLSLLTDRRLKSAKSGNRDTDENFGFWFVNKDAGCADELQNQAWLTPSSLRQVQPLEGNLALIQREESFGTPRDASNVVRFEVESPLFR